jgi:hypothetical protein
MQVLNMQWNEIGCAYSTREEMEEWVVESSSYKKHM